jgi:hypothetical protein
MSKDMIFNLSDDELTLAKTKKPDKTKLSFAVLLKYFQLENHYPKHIKFIDPLMLNTIANQLNISPSLINNFDWEGRSTERFRQEIRGILGYRAATQSDINNLKLWLFVNVLPNAVKRSQRIEYAYTYFRENKIEPFTLKELERHIRSAHREFEQQLFKSIYSGLIDKTKLQMDEFLSDDPDGVDDDEIDDNKLSDGSNIKFKHIKLDIPGVKLKNVSRAIQKINCLKQLALPEHLFSCLSTKLIKKYYTRVMAERPSGMREHNPHTRYATFSIFCYFRLQLLVDSLADLFMKLTHQLKRKSESFVDKKILTEVKCVNGKFDILYKLSVSALENPTGIIQDKIYPEVGQDTLSNLVKELYFKGKWYQTQVHLKMHSLYSHAHRRTLLTLLDSLSFKTNLNDSKPLLEAINIIKFNRDSSHEYYSDDIDVPVKNVIPNEWLSLVIIKSENGLQQINRINYEISVLQELKKQLNCKMIWIDGSFRYRDPNHDLPKDFDENREHYYGLLGLPIKHVIALKIGTMEPDIFVRRFSKDNYQHPVYRAIIEIGKVSKTNFLCRYLMIEELRIEIHEAQNVVERLNSVMGFIFYGKLGEISTNIKEYQELGIVCLHLLQACMAYINTLIFQKVLSQPEWQNILTPEDKRALNVLFHSHINPYGLFPLDLSKRLGIAAEIFDHIQDDVVPMDIMDSLIEEEVA